MHGGCSSGFTAYGDDSDSESDSGAREQSAARDDVAVTSFVMRAGAGARAGRAPARRDNSWGGPYRPDWPAGPATNPPVAGRAVPVGFARYVSPVINLGDYQFRRMAAWRVAIPRALPELRVQDLLSRIWDYGPANAGYVRIGETLVPATLDPGSRAALSGAADNGVGGTLGYNSSGLSDFRDV